MSDLKRNDILELIPPAEPTWEAVKEYCRKRCLMILTDEYYDEMVKRLNAINRWIPCKERLPEESGVYLVTRHSYIGSKLNYTDIVCYGYPEDGKRRKNRVWYFADSEYGDIAIAFDKVIAWCDLPQPYEEADE